MLFFDYACNFVSGLVHYNLRKAFKVLEDLKTFIQICKNLGFPAHVHVVMCTIVGVPAGIA